MLLGVFNLDVFLFCVADTSVIDEQSRWYKLHPHDPKKYPGSGSSHQQLNNEGGVKMARLNNPGKMANQLYLDNDDIRKVLSTTTALTDITEIVRYGIGEG